MPKIEIDTCEKTPNYCALEAIAKAMRSNYTQRKSRDYQHETVIKVESGRTIKVIERVVEVKNNQDENGALSLFGKLYDLGALTMPENK